jgi:hypothetical protein
MKDLVVSEVIEQKIYLIRGQKVMLDRDLAVLYGVQTKVLNQSVRRNKKRFPEDFVFRLTKEENISLRSQNATLNESLRSQIVTSNERQRGGRRYPPYAFTDYGIAMLSSVLNSDRAIAVNIQIIRTFIKLRKLLATHADLLKKIETMEKGYDRQFRIVFEILKELREAPKKEVRKIGFQPKNKEKNG